MFSIFQIIFLKISSKYHNFNIWPKKYLFQYGQQDLANTTESDLAWLIIFLQSLFKFNFVTTHMIKTFIWHLTHHPVTLCCLLPLMLYMRNLLTPLKGVPQSFKKKSIENVSVDDDAQSFETQNYYLQCHLTRCPSIYRNNTNT